MRRLLTPNALKTRNLYKADDDDEDDDDYYAPASASGSLATVVYEQDRAPALQPLGILDAHGDPLFRHVIPIERPIGFGRIHPDDDGAECIIYICTEAELRVEQTDAGRSDEPEIQDDIE